MLTRIKRFGDLSNQAISRKQVLIKRCQGLGNIIFLLPVLKRLVMSGYDVTVVTCEQWLEALLVLMPEVHWVCDTDFAENLIDLDEMTHDIKPCEHRTEEFVRLLDVKGPIPPVCLRIPCTWSQGFEPLRGSVVFAPESGHPSRSWPPAQAQQLWSHLQGQTLVLVGLRREVKIPCDVDFRGQMELRDLFGLLSVAAAVVTMDSSVLHIAGVLGIPAVAIFGGIDPDYRVLPNQKVVVVQAEMACCPCNKNESCEGRFDCVKTAEATEIVQAIELAKTVGHRVVMKLPCLVEA